MQIPQDLIETTALKLKSVQSEAEFFQLRAQYLGKKSFIAHHFLCLEILSQKKRLLLQRNYILKNDLTKLFENALKK